MKFSELQLKPQILRALREMGYEDLTPVQEQTLPHILAGRDLLAMAETGSGKTGACAVPLAQMMTPECEAIQALVLVPTRELAQQYVTELANVARYTGLVGFSVFGGLSMDVQKAKLNHGVHLLVATPGRLIDLLYNSELSFEEVRTFVVDEADEMMKMGFIDDVRFVKDCLVHEHQTLMWSATMPPEIERLARESLYEPVTVALNRHQRAPQSLEHHFQQVRGGSRLEALAAYVNDVQPVQAIIFCNSRTNAEKLFSLTRGRLPDIEVIHGGYEQGKRSSLIERFRQGKTRLLIATDLAGRGLDFSRVTHIINFDFPRTPEVYTHRTGRTGRMGRKGVAMTFVGDRELGVVRHLLRVNGITTPVWVGGEPHLPAERSADRRPEGHRREREPRYRGGPDHRPRAPGGTPIA